MISQAAPTPINPGLSILETDLEGRYLKVTGPAWYESIIGKTGYDYGTPEANDLLRRAYSRLNAGERQVVTGFHTVDGHSCKAIMRRVGDRVIIHSIDTTPGKAAVGDE